MSDQFTPSRPDTAAGDGSQSTAGEASARSASSDAAPVEHGWHAPSGLPHGYVGATSSHQASSTGHAAPAYSGASSTGHAAPAYSGASSTGHAAPAYSGASSAGYAAAAGHAAAGDASGSDHGPRHGYAESSPSVAPTVPTAVPTATSQRPRSGVSWSRLVAATAASAMFASVATAAFTGSFSADDTAAGTSTATTQTAAPASFSGTTSWQEVADAVRSSVVAIDVQTSSGTGAGSGVIIDAEGYVLTNAHVVSGASNDTVTVTLADGRIYEATIVGSDSATDLAVVQLVDAPEDLQAATLGSSESLAVGQDVLAVGNPLGLDSTATTGIISALDRPVVTTTSTQSQGPGTTASEPAVTNAIQVDAAINPGNSGGPLFDANGEVIGITSSIATLSGSASSGSIGLGFAIPIDQAASVAEQLIDTGTVEHAYLGVTLDDATATVVGVTRRGAAIRSVQANSPASQAGLQQGDVVVSFGGDAVGSAASLTAYVREQAVGDAQTLEVVRDGQIVEVEVTLAARAATT